MAEDVTDEPVRKEDLPLLGGGGYRAMDDLASAAEQEILGGSWPPAKGEYDDTGRLTTQAGELGTLGLVLTFGETRGFFHDLVASSPPPRLAIFGNRSRNRNTKGQPNGRRRNQ